VGYTQSYGVFQAHYASEAAVTDNIIGNKEHKSQAAIAAIGSLGNGGIVALFSILLYPWLPSLGRWVRLVCFFGACLMSLGLGLAAASRNFAHLLCTQGIIFGLGSGIIQYTLAPVLPEYFNKRAGLAQGIVIAAAGLGGGCYSPLVRALLQGIGTRKTLGVLAAIHLVVNTIASMMARGPRKFQKRKKGIVGFAAFKEPIVVLLMAVNFISALIVMVPMCFGPEFSKSLGYNSKTAALLLALTSLVGVPARLLLGCLADKLGHQNTLFAGIAVYAASAWAIWLPTAQKGNKALWIIFLILYGLVNGVAQTLIPSVQKSIFGNEKYYSYAGVFASGRGVGLLFGVLIAGELIKKADEAWEFSEAIIYTASLASIGAVCLFLVRWLQARKAGWKWVQ
ncbi:MFS general substrate transporter, partial [Lojkania enalia]